MAPRSRLRLAVVAGGMIAIIGVTAAAVAVSWVLLTAIPILEEGRLWLVVPLGLTALGTAIAGITWTRRINPTIAESIAALAGVELIILAMLVRLSGTLGSGTMDFWVVGSLPFAPWWWLGCSIGRSYSIVSERLPS